MWWWVLSGFFARILLVVFLARLLYLIGYNFYVFYLARRLGHTKDLRKLYGGWAVVTGATDGIGKGYALALARRGMSLVLLGRSDAKVKSLIEELKVVSPTSHFRSVVLDFAKYEVQNFASKIQKELEGINIGILVNNVGTMGPLIDGCQWHKLPPTPHDYANELIHVNIQSMVLMTGIILPKMIEKGKGVVINIGSMAAVFPLWRHAAYNGTKGFVSSFTRSLQFDTMGTGVSVQHVQPGYVATNMISEATRASLPSLLCPDPLQYAESAVDTIGLLDHTAGSFGHSLKLLLAWTVLCVPYPLYDKCHELWYRRGQLAKKVV